MWNIPIFHIAVFSFVCCTGFCVWTSSFMRKIKIISNIAFESLLLKIAMKYNLSTAEKKIMDNLDIACLIYKNMKGETCEIRIPFSGQSARERKKCKIILVKERSVETTQKDLI